ncbi:DUF4416 family protein [Candidatus Poribacteria bacterium]|nr:DUF4416 family protein [Candidatus Poribacteria bacterium]MYG05435.1 DUF4416 family protein [Candidatus Poribacteria bacterium]MYK21122.1 DUF4416 family protein [Candidatus Poribacteria bacterium]
MGIVTRPQPVKAVMGVLTAEPGLLSTVYDELIQHLGPIDFTSELLPFTSTNYYEVEMGPDIHRQFISFERLIDAGTLAEMKLFTNTVEQNFIRQEPDREARRVNLDAGYLCLAKLVLASTKDHAHRIYLCDGIYAEITLRFYRKTFQPWEWSYPDYRLPTYIAIFNKIREIYRGQLEDAEIF